MFPSSISFKAILHSAGGLQLKPLWLIEWLALHSNNLSKEPQRRPQRGWFQPTLDSAFVGSSFQTGILQYRRCLSIIKEMTCCRLIKGKMTRHRRVIIKDGESDAASSFQQELATSTCLFNDRASWLLQRGVGYNKRHASTNSFIWQSRSSVLSCTG